MATVIGQWICMLPKADQWDPSLGLCLEGLLTGKDASLNPRMPIFATTFPTKQKQWAFKKLNKNKYFPYFKIANGFSLHLNSFSWPQSLNHLPLSLALTWLFPLVTKSQPKQHPFNSSNTAWSSLPQSLCQCCSFCLQHSSLHQNIVGFLSLHMNLLTGHQLREMLCDHSLHSHSLSLYPGLWSPLHHPLQLYIHFHLSTISPLHTNFQVGNFQRCER